MSAPELPISLTRQAQRDSERLLPYTVQRWGEEQRHTYALAIDRALRLLGDNPGIGRPRDDIRPGYRIYPVEHHLILYRITPNTISVIRVLRNRMDVPRAMRGRP